MKTLRTTKTKTTHGWSGLGALALALALVGCEPERSRWSFAVQPDGSGSVRLFHETAGPGEEDGPGSTEPPDVADERALRQATLFLAGIDGVAAWTDVVARPLPGGRTRIEATGWYRSLADVQLLGEPRFSVTIVGEALEVAYVDPMPEGLARLFLEDREKMLETFRAPDEKFEASVHRTRGFVEMSLAGWELDLCHRLPGSITEAVGFERRGDDTVALHQDVVTVLELLDRDLAVIRALRAEVRDGALTPEEAYGQLSERLAGPTAHSARCAILAPLPDPDFVAAFEAAQADWERSEWKPRLERFGGPAK